MLKSKHWLNLTRKRRTNMCEYCDLKNYNEFEDNDFRLLIHSGSWTSLYIQRLRGHWYMIAIGDGEAYGNIKFCPFCGRKLEEEE